MSSSRKLFLIFALGRQICINSPLYPHSGIHFSMWQSTFLHRHVKHAFAHNRAGNIIYTSCIAFLFSHDTFTLESYYLNNDQQSLLCSFCELIHPLFHAIVSHVHELHLQFKQYVTIEGVSLSPKQFDALEKRNFLRMNKWSTAANMSITTLCNLFL